MFIAKGHRDEDTGKPIAGLNTSSCVCNSEGFIAQEHRCIADETVSVTVMH